MDKSGNKMKFPQFSAGTVQAVLMLALIVGAFFIGSLWTKVQLLEKGSRTAAPSTPQATAQPTAQPTVALSQIQDVFKKSYIKFGDANKKVLFVEASDPSCPYCHIAGGKNKELNSQSTQFKLVADGGTYVAPVPEMKKLVDSGKAAYALLYYPGHGSGEMGAKALYCAFEKGKYWEVNDLIMSNEGYTLLNDTVKNDTAKSGELAQFLSRVIDANTMKTCLDSGKYNDQLSKDEALAKSLNISGTPGFFINATSFPGAYSYADMEPTVNAALGNK